MRDSESKIYDVKTLFGGKNRELYELYARRIIGTMTDTKKIEGILKECGVVLVSKTQPVFVNPFQRKQLVLMIALKRSVAPSPDDPEAENEVTPEDKSHFDTVTKSIDRNLVNVL